MRILIYQAELTMASLCLFLILLAILICIEIITKSSGKLKKATIFFLIAFIPSMLYIVGRIMNIEARFTAGKFFSLTFNTLITLFVLMGLIMMNKLLKEISKKEGGEEEIKEIQEGKTEEERKNIILINAINKFKKSELLQVYPKFSRSQTLFVDWLRKEDYGKNEKEIYQKLNVTKEDFTYLFNKYKEK